MKKKEKKKKLTKDLVFSFDDLIKAQKKEYIGPCLLYTSQSMTQLST